MHLCHNSGCDIFIILLLLGQTGPLSFVPPAQQQYHCLTLPLGQGRIHCHWLGPTGLTPQVRGEHTALWLGSTYLTPPVRGEYTSPWLGPRVW